MAEKNKLGDVQAAITELRELNTRQHQESAKLQQERHQELVGRLFGSEPTSLQSQITAINDRAFSDNPTSLRSRITAREKDDAVSRGRLALLVAIVTFLITFFAVKWQTIAGWLGFAPKTPSDLHNIMPGRPGQTFGEFAWAFAVRAEVALRALLARLWLLGVFVVCVIGPKAHSVLRRIG